MFNLYKMDRLGSQNSPGNGLGTSESQTFSHCCTPSYLMEGHRVLSYQLYLIQASRAKASLFCLASLFQSHHASSITGWQQVLLHLCSSSPAWPLLGQWRGIRVLRVKQGATVPVFFFDDLMRKTTVPPPPLCLIPAAHVLHSSPTVRLEKLRVMIFWSFPR